MTGVIALLGATGFTGRLVAAELAGRSQPCRLGARSLDRLSRLPRGDRTETFRVDVNDRAQLDRFLAGANVLINTVGPFKELGLPVVEAAVRNSVAYVDSTGEPSFMEEVYRRFRDAPVPVVPACGFDCIPGDLAAAIAAADLGGAVTEVGVHYEVRGMLPSRGTARSGLRMLEGQRVVLARTRVRFIDGERDAIEWAGGERLTIPRHLPGAMVRVTMLVPGLLVPGLAMGAVAIGLLAPILRGLVNLMPEGPPPGLREMGRYRILVEALGPAGRAAVLCEGSDPYGVTARFLVEAAERIRGRGAMTPAETFDPESFLNAVSGEAFRWARLSERREASTR
jgi:hypothetical protein